MKCQWKDVLTLCFVLMLAWPVSVLLFVALAEPMGVRIDLSNVSETTGCPCGVSCACPNCTCVCDGGTCPIEGVRACKCDCVKKCCDGKCGIDCRCPADCKCSPKPIGAGVAE